MQEVDIILEGGTILTLDDADTIIPSGAVAIRKDTIVAVGPRSDVAGRYRGRTVIEATNHVIMPGLVNAHTHAAMTCFRGIADDLELMEWLNQLHLPRRGEKRGPGACLLGKPAGLRRDDPLRNDNLLRHVHLRGRDGESGKPRRDALPSRGGAFRFPLPQFQDAR